MAWTGARVVTDECAAEVHHLQHRPREMCQAADARSAGATSKRSTVDSTRGSASAIRSKAERG